MSETVSAKTKVAGAVDSDSQLLSIFSLERQFQRGFLQHFTANLTMIPKQKFWPLSFYASNQNCIILSTDIRRHLKRRAK